MDTYQSESEELDNLDILNISEEIINIEIEKSEKVRVPYKHLVLSGGSVRGISQIGAIKKLVDEGLLVLDKIESVAGTSSGSLLGVLIVLGFSIDAIWDFMYSLDIKKLVNPNLLLLLTKCGVETGCTIHNLFEDILTKVTKIKHINFRQLYELTKIDLTIVGSCLTTKEAVYYNHTNTPTFKVSMALRISISLPGFFIPVTIGNNKYIDGGVLDNYAIELFKDKIDDTIGILVCDVYNTNYEYPEQYVAAVMNLFMDNFYKKISYPYQNNTIYIDKKPTNVSTMNFDVNNECKNELFACGIEATSNFIKKNGI